MEMRTKSNISLRILEDDGIAHDTIQERLAMLVEDENAMIMRAERIFDRYRGKKKTKEYSIT
jgi:hypothetical protein